MATVQLSSGLRLILIDFHITSHALCATSQMLTSRKSRLNKDNQKLSRNIIFIMNQEHTT